MFLSFSNTKSTEQKTRFGAEAIVQEQRHLYITSLRYKTIPFYRLLFITLQFHAWVGAQRRLRVSFPREGHRVELGSAPRKPEGEKRQWKDCEGENVLPLRRDQGRRFEGEKESHLRTVTINVTDTMLWYPRNTYKCKSTSFWLFSSPQFSEVLF